MSLQIPRWAKDKRVQVGIAVAAGLGLFMLIKRQRSGGAAGGSTSDGTGSTPQSITPAVMDSSGTDIYNAISSLGQGWENDLRDYSSQLDSVSSQIAKNTTSIGTLTDKLGTTKPPSGTVTPPVRTNPKVMALNPKLKTGQGFYIIKAGDTQSAIAQKAGISTSLLNAFNPGGKLSHLGVGEAVRIRAVAGPAPAKIWR